MEVKNTIRKSTVWGLFTLSALSFYPVSSVYAEAFNVDAIVEANQQQTKITGIVKDEFGESVPGANILVKGTTNGTITDIDGKFVINAHPGETLIVSFVGYANLEVKVTPSKTDYNIHLKPDNQLLDEVIVTGYQTISKERATGSFAIMTPKDMEGKLQTNVLDRMEGMVAGMKMIPGKTPEIRGVSTLSGSKTPLYVVDGIPYEGSLDAINPADIVNVTVLKDATAASIYGARSANGVIVISTRMGQTGKIRANYSGSVKFKPLPSRDYLNLTSSRELVDFQKEMFGIYHNSYDPSSNRSMNEVYQLLYENEAGNISDSDLEKRLDVYRNRDKYDQIKDEYLRSTEITHQHNLSFSGGSDIYKYSLSANYQGSAPYEKEKLTQRVGFNFRNQFDFFKWLRVDVGLLNSNVSEDYDNGFSGYSYLNSGASYRVIRNEDGTPAQWYKNKSQIEIDRLNSLGLKDETYIPLKEQQNGHYNYDSDYLNLNLGVTFKIMKGLSLDLRYQTEKTKIYSKQYYTKDAIDVKSQINDATVIDKDGKVTNYIPLGGQVTEGWNKNNSYTMRAQLNFNRDFFDKHSVQIIAGGERRKVVTQSSSIQKLGYDDISLSFKQIDANVLSATIKNTQAIFGSYSYKSPDSFGYTDDRYVSFYGNASYTFDRKFTLTGSVRVDQSNLFGTDPKYQYKPLWSVGAQYVVAENWNWVDRLAARMTYGINGNVAKKSGPYMISMDNGTNYYTNEYQANITTPPNPELRWEKTGVFNIGIDFNTLGNRLNGSIEFYNKKTVDLMGNRQTDPTMGWSSLMLNYGEMYNRGVEVTLQSNNIVTRNFSWSSGFIFSYNKNKLTKIENSGTSASSYYSKIQDREGHPMGALYAIRYAGLDETGMPMAYKADGSTVKSSSYLSAEDLVYAGTTVPPYSASLSNRLTYKGFDLDFMFVFYGGHKLRDVASGYAFTMYPILNYASNMDRDRLNFWRQPGDENNPDMAPAFLYGKGANSTASPLWASADKHIEKGDYIKLRDLALGYTFPKVMIRKCYLQNLRLNMQVQNLFYWAANKNNLDPEVWSGTTAGSTSRGTHFPATFTFGVSADF